MRTTIRLPTLIVCILLLALPATAARANGSDDSIVQDCQHSQSGALTGSYSKAQLRHALRNLASDVLEYSGCYDAIRQAMLASAGGGDGGNGSGNGPGGGSGGTGAGGIGGGSDGSGGSGGTGTTAPVTNAQPPPGADRPVELAGTAIAPGALPELGRDAHKLPTPLLVLLVLLGVAALVSAGLTIGRRVVARRRA